MSDQERRQALRQALRQAMDDGMGRESDEFKRLALAAEQEAFENGELREQAVPSDVPPTAEDDAALNQAARNDPAVEEALSEPGSIGVVDPQGGAQTGVPDPGGAGVTQNDPPYPPRSV